MITPKLEQLIFQGQAFYKTYVAGPVKSTLNIDNDRFIIITDITFSGYCNNDAQNTPANVQLNIYGEKGFNHYVFRNVNFNSIPVYNANSGGIEILAAGVICEPITINTYLLHTTQVGFSFGLGGTLGTVNIAQVTSNNPSFPPPLDYGKNGDIGSVNVAVTTINGTMLNVFTNRALPDNVISTEQIQFPFSAGSIPSTATPQFAFAQINYVEILGQPENIQF